MFAAAEAGLGHSLIGGEEQLVFLGILAIGFVFEGVWYLRRHGNAVTAARFRPASRSGYSSTNTPGFDDVGGPADGSSDPERPTDTLVLLVIGDNRPPGAGPRTFRRNHRSSAVTPCSAGPPRRAVHAARTAESGRGGRPRRAARTSHRRHVDGEAHDLYRPPAVLSVGRPLRATAPSSPCRSPETAFAWLANGEVLPQPPAELHTDGALPPPSRASSPQKLTSPTFHVPFW